MIVIEDKRSRIVLIAFAADSSVTRAEVAIVNMIKHRRRRAVDHLTDPWAILTMRCHDDPLFA